MGKGCVSGVGHCDFELPSGPADPDFEPTDLPPIENCDDLMCDEQFKLPHAVFEFDPRRDSFGRDWSDRNWERIIHVYGSSTAACDYDRPEDDSYDPSGRIVRLDLASIGSPVQTAPYSPNAVPSTDAQMYAVSSFIAELMKIARPRYLLLTGGFSYQERPLPPMQDIFQCLTAEHLASVDYLGVHNFFLRESDVNWFKNESIEAHYFTRDISLSLFCLFESGLFFRTQEWFSETSRFTYSTNNRYFYSDFEDYFIQKNYDFYDFGSAP
jgi:hypothetical protein